MTQVETNEIKSLLLKIAVGVVVAVMVAAGANVAALVYWKGGLDEWRRSVDSRIERIEAAIFPVTPYTGP